MERAISVEERIRRAEERYNKKNGSNLHNSNFKARTNNINKKSKKKYLMYIFICLLIYMIFYIATNSEYIFSENFKKDTNSFFTEKTHIYEIYSNIKSYIDKNIFKKEDKNLIDENTEQTNEKNENAEQVNQENQDTEQVNDEGQNVEHVIDENQDAEKINEENQDIGQVNNEVKNIEIEITNEENENLGGAEEITPQQISELQDTEETITIEKTQMEKDVDEIKSKLSFINPIEGRISSTFGWRNPTNPNVPKYHTGLDISAVTGTVIKSATDGIVEVASSDGDYGKHYYIKYDNITIIYAHCSKLYLKKGDVVKQGQEIAKVGSTGLSTGPHLHIGIKLDDRWVDPRLILNI